MVVIRGNIERMINDSEVQKYIANGYKPIEEYAEKIEEKVKIHTMKIEQLKEIAKEKGIKGYSSLTKKELLSVLKDVI